jgi:hypothetical protein
MKEAKNGLSLHISVFYHDTLGVSQLRLHRLVNN